MPGKPFQPGQSGNPGGRKRGIERVFQDAIAQLKSDSGAAGFQVLIDRLTEIALKGDHKDSIAAIKLLVERAAGAPKATVVLEGEAEAAPAFDWGKVPLDLRRQVLAAITEPDGTSTEH